MVVYLDIQMITRKDIEVGRLKPGVYITGYPNSLERILEIVKLKDSYLIDSMDLTQNCTLNGQRLTTSWPEWHIIDEDTALLLLLKTL